MNAHPVLTPERIDAMLSIMAEVCLGSVVEAGQRQKAAPDDEAFERSGRALNQACRNLRQTIALKQRFDREEVAKAREAHAAAEADRKGAERDRQARIELKRKRVRRHLENLVWDEYDDEDADAFCHEVDQRLSDLVYEDDFLDTPIEDLITRLADDIGLNDEPEPEPVEAGPEPEASRTEPGPREPSPPSQPLAAGPPSLRDPPPVGVDGERVGSGGVGSAPEGSHPEGGREGSGPEAAWSGGVSSELEGSHPNPRPLPARGRGEPAHPPRPPDPPPQPYIPPWERLRPGQRMPGGSGW